MTSRVLCKATAWLMTAILLMTTLLTAMPLTALAEGDPVSLTLGDVSALPGETVKVPLSVQSTKGLANFDATITYNSSVFTVGDGEWNTSALGGNPYYDFVDQGNGTLKIVYIGTSNTQANTTLLYIPLTVAANTSGTYTLGLQVGGLQVYDDVYGDDFGGYSPSVFSYSGSVTVRSDPGAVTFKVSPQSSSVASGGTVKVDVMLESTSGVSNFGLTLTFDKSKLTPQQQSDGEWAVWNSTVMGSASSSRYFVTNYNSSNGTLYLGFIASKANTSASGKIATITFKAASLTSASTVTITPSNNDAQYYAPNHGDADEYGYVTPSISLTGGKVSIKAATTTTTKATTTTTKATTTTTKATTTTTKATTTTTKVTTTTTKATTTTTKKVTTTTTSLDIRETVTLSAGMVSEAQVGDIIQVPIMMSDNHYAVSGTIDIGYTASVLEPQMVADGQYIDAIDTTVIPGGTGSVSLASSGKLRLTFSSSKTVGGTTSGAVVILNFKVLSYVAETPITLTVSALKSNNGYSGGNYNTTYVVQNGTVQQIAPVTTKTTTGTHPTAATPVTFTVISNTDVVHSGQVVAMDIVLDSKLGLSNFGLTLTFNNNALTPIEQSTDSWVEWNTDAIGTASSSVYVDDYYKANGSSSTVKLSYVASKKNTQPQCVLATVYFRVNESYLGTSASKTVTVTPSCSDAQYYDTVNGNKYGYVTPSKTTLTKETITVYQPLTIDYYSMTDMVHTMTVANTGTAVEPTDFDVTPKKLNYSFIGWAIASQTAAYVRCEAIYGYIVEVTAGSITSSYVPSGQWLTSSKKAYFCAPSTYNGGILGYDNRVQITANATSSSKVFSYWKDEHGNVVSYDRTFTFFVPGNVKLTPVYATTAATKKPTASMQIVRGEYNNPTNQKGSITWVCAFNRGDTAKYSVTEWGIIYGPSTVYSDLTSGDTTKARKETASGYSQDSNQYSYTINNVSVGKTRSAIAYAIYTELSTGKSYTVYSPNLLSMTMANTL